MLRRLRNAYKIEISRPRGRKRKYVDLQSKKSRFQDTSDATFSVLQSSEIFGTNCNGNLNEIRAAIFKNLCKMSSSSPKQESKFSSLFFLQESYCVVKI